MVIDQTPGKPKAAIISGHKENIDNCAERVRLIITGNFNTSSVQQVAHETAASQAYFEYQTDLIQAFDKDAKAINMEKAVWLLDAQDALGILGKRGNCLKQLQRQSAAKFNLNFIDEKPGNFSDMEISSEEESIKKCILTITGPPFAVSRALQLLYERISINRVTVLQAATNAPDNAHWKKMRNAKRVHRKAFFGSAVSPEVKRKIESDVFANKRAKNL
jgi:hypothetical protein